MTNDKSPEQAAEEWVAKFDLPEEVEGLDKSLGLGVYKINIFGKNAFLAGIEHERKRRKYYEVKFPDDLVTALNEARDDMIVGFPKAVIKCTDGDLELPLEQVGEKHWRIKDGHE